MYGIIRFQGPFGNPITKVEDLPANLDDVMVFHGLPGKRFKVKAWEANGHLEMSASRETLWEELNPGLFDIEACVRNMEKEREEKREERERRNRDKACKRAKRAVRRCCKAMGADTLLTLTYQANETDLAAVKHDLKLYVQRVQRLVKDFCCVAAFEKQKRGAWHVHMATRGIPRMLPASNGVKVKSFNVLRAIWRAVVKERGGNIDVSRKAASLRSAARIASYISAYIAKDFEEVDKWVNRYAVYGAKSSAAGDGNDRVFDPKDVPKEVVLGYASDANEAIRLCVGMMRPGAEVVTMLYSRFGHAFYLAAESPP